MGRLSEISELLDAIAWQERRSALNAHLPEIRELVTHLRGATLPFLNSLGRGVGLLVRDTLSVKKPHLILDEYGYDVLFQVYTTEISSGKADKFAAAICQHRGAKKEELEAARLMEWRRRLGKHGEPDTSRYDALGVSMTLELMLAAAKYESTGRLQHHLRSRSTASSRNRLEQYTIERDLPLYYWPYHWAEKWSGVDARDGGSYNVYLDGMVGLLVCKEHEPVGVLALKRVGHDTLRIMQLQGVNREFSIVCGERTAIKTYPNHAWSGVDMRGTLVDIACDIAEDLGYAELSIVAGRDVRWTKPLEGEPPHITVEYAESVYDATAQRLGFQLGADNQWYKPAVDKSKFVEIGQVA